MKKLFYISLVFTLFNCSSEKQPILKSDVKEKSEATKFTFSQPLMVDFMVAEGQYQILYDYSRPVDTIFANSGAFVVGKDSILYTQLRKSKFDELADYQNSKCYIGDPTNLILYDGNQFEIIKPNYFNPYMSSFFVINKDIYYWGFDEGLYACSYNLRTKVFKKVLLQEESPGTDFYGYFDQPNLNSTGKIEFNIDGEYKYVFDENLIKVVFERKFNENQDMIENDSIDVL